MLKKILFCLSCIVLIVGIVGCSAQQKEQIVKTREITDMAGRTLEIPQEIKKVYATNPIGTIFIYTLSPDMVAGWNNDLRPLEKKYLNKDYHDLPILGTWRGANCSGNIEEILKVNPDIIINMGDVNPKYISYAENIQEVLDIPVLMADGSLENLENTYKFMGDLLGLEERANHLADYSLQTIKDIQETIGKIPEEERVKVFYAEGPKGLETEPRGSLNSEVIEFSGCVNVASTNLGQPIKRMQVSFEQLFAWDPEVIIISSDADSKHRVYNNIISDSTWQHIQAAKNKNVYEIPYGPYDWLNRPPSIMRVLGVKWLANLLYPESYNIDIENEIKDFFLQFFSYELSDQELNDLIKLSQKEKE